jgi:hypothetical protein
MTRGEPKHAEPYQLDYVPGPRWYRRKRQRRAIGLTLLFILIAVGYWQRDRLKQYQADARLALVQWRCLNYVNDPNAIAYAEGIDGVVQLSTDPRYLSLPDGSVGRKCAQWDDLMKALGRRTFLWPNEGTGGIVFLHERYTPSGRRLIVRASYAPIPRSPRHRSLAILLLDVPSLTVPTEFAGGLACDDGYLLSGEPKDLDPNPPARSLRLFCGQPDPSDRTQFWIDFELNGQRNRATFQILDPDPRSTVPTWPRVQRLPPPAR